MPRCELCSSPALPGGLAPVAGLVICERCRAVDPAPSLAEHGVAVEWDARLGRFSAGLGIPDQDPKFTVKCVPELWAHKLAKIGIDEVEVGDPSFDGRVFVRTNSPEAAKSIMAGEGVREALLALLGNVRVNELLGNHVTLEGPTLTVSTSPRGGLEEARVQELKLAVAALSLHLLRHRRRASAAPGE